jgi:HD-GYP domain-containing protein (c-di-GMP phosphodiesterase class II)/DNA-binding CsgD family transcriptional regulator
VADVPAAHRCRCILRGMSPGSDVESLRLVELLGAISLATDLGTGQPLGHGLRTSVLATALAQELGLNRAAVAGVQRVALLRFLGCTADSAETARMTGGDDLAFLSGMAPVAMGSRPEGGRRLIQLVGADRPAPQRAALMARALGDPGAARRSLSAHCEVAAMLARRLGVGPEVTEALAHAYERWDGRGFPEGLRGDAIPLAVRVSTVARDADLFWRAGSAEMAELLRARRGRAYDPAVVDACLAIGPEVLPRLDGMDPWEPMLAADEGSDVIPVPRLDETLTALADFADLKSPWTRGHSRRVATLAAAAASEVGMAGEEATRLRRAALVHDLGRVGVPNGIWDRPGALGVVDRERVRMHPYLTEVTVSCCPALSGLGRLAGAHHERLDGSGYHRGARELGTAERLLAVADLVAAMGEPRPYRPPATPSTVADAVREEVAGGRLDATAADAVLAALGQGVPPVGPGRRAVWPAGLSGREVEVLRLIARGRTNREVAADLYLSPKTVGRHVENLYTKIGVRSRAAAAVFAMEHHLLDP